ncbi:MAG: flavodoxin family protein [Oscillospiraceae bacterium]|jgi:multimeric flavodoxin WrbA
MKVLLINGSPRGNGNTALALSEVAHVLESEGVKCEIVWLGNKPVRDCIACRKCADLDNACVFDDDIINDLIRIAETADGFVFGTPVYYAHPNGRILSVMNRLFFAGKPAFSHKPAAAVAVARRAGATASLDVINKYFTISEMPVVSSTYWNMAYGANQGEAEEDLEGLQTMRNLGKNMAWLLKCIEAGKEKGIDIPDTDKEHVTSFIR